MRLRRAARISLVVDHVVSPSEQSRKRSPGSRLDGERVDVDVGLGAERAGDHGALRVAPASSGESLPLRSELVDERVVVGELLELAAAQTVRARVADVADRDRAAVSSTSATVIVVPMPEAAASSCERW